MSEAKPKTAAMAVNAGLMLTYWHGGQRLRIVMPGRRRASYGESIVATVSRQLTADVGRSFSVKYLRHTMRSIDAFPSLEIVSTLSRQWAYSHSPELVHPTGTESICRWGARRAAASAVCRQAHLSTMASFPDLTKPKVTA